MAATTTPRPRISTPRTGTRAYDAFVSYSHAADGRLAPALQRGLQSLAKPWYRRRALRVFRDQTSLSASPELWSAIEEALSQARYFVLLASPEAAASRWVDQEVRWWRENTRPRHRSDRSYRRGARLGRRAQGLRCGGADPARPSGTGSHASRCGSICVGRETSATSRCATRASATAWASSRRPCTVAQGRADRRGHQPAPSDVAARQGGGGSPRAAVGAGRGRRDRGATSAK